VRNSAITLDNVGFKILEETFTKIMQHLFTCKYHNGKIFFTIFKHRGPWAQHKIKFTKNNCQLLNRHRKLISSAAFTSETV